MMHGEQVALFEREFARYVGAHHAIAMTNGTVTIQVALMALGLKPGEKVATTALTMAATTIAILNAGGVPHYVDVDPDTWVMAHLGRSIAVPVSLYGLCSPEARTFTIDDAAQTLRKHSGCEFTSYSLQRSKILNTGEGGMLVTNDDQLATDAREIASLGYKMDGKARIDSAVLKSPTYDRHHRRDSLNARMNDATARVGLSKLAGKENDHGTWYDYGVDVDLVNRARCASYYREAIAGCDWLTPQHVPEGWTHDYWTYAVACKSYAHAELLARDIVRCGGEAPYPAWKLTYDEPAFHHLAPAGGCPIAESLQPRLLQFQTNDLASAERNAKALRATIARASAYRASRLTGIPCG